MTIIGNSYRVTVRLCIVVKYIVKSHTKKQLNIKVIVYEFSDCTKYNSKGDRGCTWGKETDLLWRILFIIKYFIANLYLCIHVKCWFYSALCAGGSRWRLQSAAGLGDAGTVQNHLHQVSSALIKYWRRGSSVISVKSILRVFIDLWTWTYFFHILTLHLMIWRTHTMYFSVWPRNHYRPVWVLEGRGALIQHFSWGWTLTIWCARL